MTHVSVVAVFGLSGVGKSWIIARYMIDTSALHVQASQLLREAKEPFLGENVSAEDLRKGAVLDNQTLLIQAFTRLRETATQPILFDGHCVVDDGEELLEIPVEVIGSLAITSIVFIEGSAKGIADRRRNDLTRVRPIRSAEELDKHQQRAKQICQAYSKILDVPLTIVAAGDEAAFMEAVEAGLTH